MSGSCHGWESTIIPNAPLRSPSGSVPSGCRTEEIVNSGYSEVMRGMSVKVGPGAQDPIVTVVRLRRYRSILSVICLAELSTDLAPSTASFPASFSSARFFVRSKSRTPSSSSSRCMARVSAG